MVYLMNIFFNCLVIFQSYCSTYILIHNIFSILLEMNLQETWIDLWVQFKYSSKYFCKVLCYWKRYRKIYFTLYEILIYYIYWSYYIILRMLFYLRNPTDSTLFSYILTNIHALLKKITWAPHWFVMGFDIYLIFSKLSKFKMAWILWASNLTYKTIFMLYVLIYELKSGV